MRLLLGGSVIRPSIGESGPIPEPYHSVSARVYDRSPLGEMLHRFRLGAASQPLHRSKLKSSEGQVK